MKIDKKEENFVIEASEKELMFLVKALRTARERHYERMHILPSSAFEDDEVVRKADATREGIRTFLDAYCAAREGHSVVTHTTDETFDLGREYL